MRWVYPIRPALRCLANAQMTCTNGLGNGRGNSGGIQAVVEISDALCSGQVPLRCSPLVSVKTAVRACLVAVRSRAESAGGCAILDRAWSAWSTAAGERVEGRGSRLEDAAARVC